MVEIRLVEGFPEADWPAIVALAARIGGFDEGFFRHSSLDRRKILKVILQRHLD